MFYTWWVSGCSPTFVWPIHSYAPRGVHPLPCLPYSSVHLYVLRGFCMLWEVVKFLYMLDTSPCMGVLPHMFTSPTHLMASLCISMFWGCLYVIWGKFPLCWRFGGVTSSVGGFGGISTWCVHMLFLVCSSCMFF